MCDNRNKFCYICGLFTDISHRRDFKNNIGVVEVYNKVFNRSFDTSRWYEPEFVCQYCCNTLKKKKIQPSFVLPFSTPMIWHHQPYHKPNDCYFCQTDVLGHCFKTRKNIKYANVVTVTKPIPLSNDLPTTSKSDDVTEKDFEQEEFLPSRSTTTELHFLSKADFDDLVRDLHLSKRQSEVLGSRLKQWNLVEKDFVITSGRKSDRTWLLEESFKTSSNDSDLVYCVDVPKLFSALNHNYNADEWRLFIDGSCKSKFSYKNV